MVIIVSGAKGIGKTTVCRKLIEIVRNRGHTCGGILTYKAPDGCIIIEDIQTGEREILASINNVYHGPRTRKYFFSPEGIDFGIKAMARGISSDILFVDEIGYLELNGGGFAKILELIRAGKVKDSVLVIRKDLLSTFSAWLDSKWLILETTRDNRDELPRRIYSFLRLQRRSKHQMREGL